MHLLLDWRKPIPFLLLSGDLLSPKVSLFALLKVPLPQMHKTPCGTQQYLFPLGDSLGHSGEYCPSTTRIALHKVCVSKQIHNPNIMRETLLCFVEHC